MKRYMLFNIFMVLGFFCTESVCAEDFVTINKNGNVLFRQTDGEIVWSTTSGNISGVAMLAIGPDGNVYGSTSLGDDAEVWDGQTGEYLGDVITASAVGGISRVYGITFGPDVDGDGIEDLYSFEGGSATSNYVHSWTSSSGYLEPGSFTVENKCTHFGAWDGDFGPDVTGDGIGELFIMDGTDQTANNYVTVVNGADPTAAVVNEFPIAECNRPGCLVAGSDGRIYIASRNNDRVVSYTADGSDPQIVVDITGCNFPTQIAEGGNGQWYISNRFNITGLVSTGGSVVYSANNFDTTSVLIAGTVSDDYYGAIAVFPPSGYEAEDADYSGLNVIEEINASSGRCLDSFDTVGNYVRFQEIEAGNTLEIRYSNALTTTQCSVYVNGMDVATASFSSTGDWSTFDTMTVEDMSIPDGAEINLQIDADDHVSNHNGTCAILDKIEIQNQAGVIVVNSIAQLLTIVDQNDLDVKMMPGDYLLDEDDVASGLITSEQFIEFSGSNCVYDFTDVTFNIHTNILNEFGNISTNSIYISGHNNHIFGLTVRNIDNEKPYRSAQTMRVFGDYNKIEDVSLYIRGSYPYAYGDMFGKGSDYVIKHWKHSALLINGIGNHILNCYVESQAYGHGIFMQGAVDTLIEGCYVKGFTRTTDEVLAETSGPAFDKNFMTVWGWPVPAGYTFSLSEDGIRCYNNGTTSAGSRDTANTTVKNCTVEGMRGGVTIGFSNGTNSVSGCTVIAGEGAYWPGNDDTVEHC